MARTMLEARWRIQCRRGLFVLREHCDRGQADHGRFLFAAMVSEFERDARVDVELQEREAGHRVYRRVLLARAGRVVPPDGRKLEGKWGIYDGPVFPAVERGLVRW